MANRSLFSILQKATKDFYRNIAIFRDMKHYFVIVAAVVVAVTVAGQLLDNK